MFSFPEGQTEIEQSGIYKKTNIYISYLVCFEIAFHNKNSLSERKKCHFNFKHNYLSMSENR